MDERARLRRVEDRVERRIAELRDAGELTGLPGEGAPLPADPDDAAGDLWAAQHIVRTSGSRPQWADLRREIAAQRARIVTRLRAHLAWLERRRAHLDRVPAERIVSEAASTTQTDARVRADIASAVEELNALIRRHNLLVSAASLHIGTVSVGGLEEIARTAHS